MPYTPIDHTADIGIHVTGVDAKSLFTDAAYGLVDHIIDRTTLTGDLKESIDITGIDWPDLMVCWLRELLYFWNGRGILIKGVDIQMISEGGLNARVSGNVYNPEEHTIIGEVKAVTYHQILVSRTLSGWEANIIFDV
jgi:SHS2 domain-containing protein